MKWPRPRRNRKEPDPARHVADIVTARLRLRAITTRMMQAEHAADGSLAPLLSAELTAEWPPVHWEPHVFALIEAQLTDRSETAGWHRYILLPQAGGETLIGCTGGFPKSNGDVEIGYSTLPHYQRRGYATEAVAALIEHLFAQPEVRSVSAQTWPHVIESIKVMERCGLQLAGAGDEPGAALYRRQRATS